MLLAHALHSLGCRLQVESQVAEWSQQFPGHSQTDVHFSVVLLVWKNNPFRLLVWLSEALPDQKPRMDSSSVNYDFLSH